MLRGEQSQAGGPEDPAGERPRVAPAAEAGKPQPGTVRKRPGHGVDDDRGERAEAGDPAEHGFLVSRVDRRDLLGQQLLDRGEEAHEHGQVGQHEQRDPRAAYRLDRLGECISYRLLLICSRYH